jgi:hypothetical protein
MSPNSLPTPPEWAEALLRLTLKQDDRESVSGDLLEEYRSAIAPSRGSAAADTWYLRQVAGFLWRATWIWAVVFSGQFVARTAYDWAVPTHDFHLRAEWSTQLGVTTMLLVALWSSWRSGSFVAGPILAAVTSQVAAIFTVSAAVLMLALWPDPAGHLDRAIAESGGIEEVYVLPFMMIIPALIVGTVGGAIGSVSRMLVRRTARR